MWDFLKKFFATPPASQVETPMGDVFTFKTKPVFEHNDLDTGRYGALKVVEQRGDFLGVVAYDIVGIGAPPSLAEIERAGILKCERLGFGARPQPCAMYVFANTVKQELNDLQLLARLPISSQETELLEKFETYGTASSISIDVEAEWNWRNKREVVESWARDHSAKEKKALKNEKAARSLKLSKSSLQDLAAQSFFPHWELPPEAFTKAVRSLLSDEISALARSKRQPSRAAARKALVALIEGLNELDAKHENPIETEEREDLMEVIEEIAYAAKHPELLKEIDGFRDW